MQDFDFTQAKAIYDAYKKTNIYPFVWRNGFINLTENGYVGVMDKSTNYSFYQKYSSGKDDLNIVWENSTTLSVYDTNKGQMKYNFKVGNYYKAVLIQPAECSLEIGKNENNDSFIRLQDDFNATYIFYGKKFTSDDLYTPWVILEESQRRVLFLINFQNYYDPKRHNEVITICNFVASKDKLITSGKAIEQFIHFGAPGEPYAFPEEDEDGNVYLSKSIGQTIDQVKYAQIELQGPSAFATAIISGRKIWKDENGDWVSSAPMFLFPSQMLVAQQNQLNKTGPNSTSFYCFANESVETRSDKEFQDAIKGQSSSLAPLKNQGVFTLGLNSEWANLQHQSNTIDNLTNMRAEITDQTWLPLENFAHDQQNMVVSRNTSGNLYTTNDNDLLTTDNVCQIIAKNAMAFMTQTQLSLDAVNSKPYRLSVVPIFGNLIKRFYGDYALSSNYTKIKTMKLCYFVDCSVAQNCYQQFTQPTGSDVRAYGNIQNLNAENHPQMSCMAGINTSLAFKLSNKVSFDYNHKRFEVSTADFAQEKDENGNWFFDDHSPLRCNMDKTSNFNIINTDDSFIIDNIVVLSLYEGKIKISFFGENNASSLDKPIYTQTMLSSSLFESENIRNWWTEINIGCWSQEFLEASTIDWPIQPYKNTSSNVEFLINRTTPNLFTHYNTLGFFDAGVLTTYKNADAVWIRDAVQTTISDVGSFLGYSGKTNVFLKDNNILLNNYFISWEQIGGVGYTKQQFINDYWCIRFNFDGSTLRLGKYNASVVDGGWSIYTNQIVNNDEIELEFAVGVFNPLESNYINAVAIPVSSSTNILSYGVSSSGFNRINNDSISQKVHITITATNTGLYISADAHTRIYTQLNYNVDSTKNISYGSRYAKDLYSNIKLYSISLIKK